MSVEGELALRVATSPAWLPLACARFDDVLRDHAHCEKKAAAHALSLLNLYPHVPGLARAMAHLAMEESDHLAQVVAIIEKRGLTLGRDTGDPYARGLQAHVRQGEPARLVDQLLASALIEARSRERLDLLASGLDDPELRAFYSRLALSEAGHGTLFVRLAQRVDPTAAARLPAWLDREAELIRALPVRAAIH